jgi:hypothetical protein
MYERIIFIPFFRKPILRQLELPIRASPHLCSDNRTKGRKPLFESRQWFAVSIRLALIAGLSECVLDKEEFSFLISH